jgi:3-isopropylmalate/(R)-2-methylmalate dehydratase small subunit
MQAFTVLTSAAVPLPIAKIDTGMILPGRYMRRHRRPGHDYSEAFLHDIRFDANEKPRPDCALNDPAYGTPEILLTDADFGCGSSREGAAYAVMPLCASAPAARSASISQTRSLPIPTATGIPSRSIRYARSGW